MKAVAKPDVNCGKKRGCFSRNITTILVCCSLILLIAAVVCAVTNIFEDWVEDKIKDGVKLVDGNKVYDRWLNPETPSYISYYMFNVTNAESVSKGGKPNVQQHGPYTYRAPYKVTLISRNKYSRSSFTCSLLKYRVFDRSLSCENCDPIRDSFTTVNFPLYSTLEMIAKHIKIKDSSSLSFPLAIMEDILVKLNLQAFHTRTVNELLWGYENTALTKAYDILIGLAKSRNPTLNIKLPRKFAFQKNGSVSWYTLDSGEHDVDRVGEYLRWNNKTNFNCWGNKYANMLNGTISGHRKPYLSKDDTVNVVVTSVYRTLQMRFHSVVNYKGIRLYRFIFDRQNFVSGDIDANNKPFCVSGKDNKCLQTGLMDMSQCNPSHAPIVISMPHFYLGNESLQATVNGLGPKKELHETFLDIEPHTGLTMRGSRKVQINANLHNIPKIKPFKDTTAVYLPVMYIDKHAKISEKDADDFKHAVMLPLRMAQAAPFILIGLAAILLLTAGITSYRRYMREEISTDEKFPFAAGSNTTSYS